MNPASRQDFNGLTIEQQEQLRERLATHDFGDLTDEEQALIRDRLRHEPFCGYPSQIWIGQGGPVRKGDLEPPIFSSPVNPDKNRVKGGDDVDFLDIPWFLKGEPRRQKQRKGFVGWLKGLLGKQ